MAGCAAGARESFEWFGGDIVARRAGQPDLSKHERWANWMVDADDRPPGLRARMRPCRIGGTDPGTEYARGRVGRPAPATGHPHSTQRNLSLSTKTVPGCEPASDPEGASDCTFACTTPVSKYLTARNCTVRFDGGAFETQSSMSKPSVQGCRERNNWLDLSRIITI